MNLLSAKNVFSDIFDWFASLSSKLPSIDYKTYFIVVVVLLLGVGLIVALTYFGSYRFKLLVACRKIIAYLADVEAIDNENFGDFTAQCFSVKVPSTLRDCWVQYLGVRFGYPSDIVSEQNVYDKEVKRVREIRANVFIAVALIIIAIFSFWGYGRLEGNDMGVIFLASLLLSGIIYLVLVILNKMLSNRCLDVFNNMQEDLDAKVIFQVEKSFATDASPLGDLAAIIDEIVARNTAKELGFEFADEQTPIEELIAKADDDNADDGFVEEEIEFTKNIDVDDEIKNENNSQNESAAEEGTDVEPENMTIDDIIVEDSEPVVDEEQGASDDKAEAEQDDVGGDEEVANDENESNCIGEASDDVNDLSNDANEPQSDDDGAIYGVVEDIKEESEPEKEKDAEEVIDGEPVEVISENNAEEYEEKEGAKDDGQKKNLNSDEDSNVNEPDAEVAIEQAHEEFVAEGEKEEQATDEASSDINEQVIEEQPMTYVDEQEKQKVEEQKIKSEVDNNDVEDEEPIIQYVMDGPSDDDDEIVKPAQLVKMPNLVDYMIAQNASPKIKMNIVNKLMASYKKFENSEDDKQIITDCIKKLMADLQKKK